MKRKFLFMMRFIALILLPLLASCTVDVDEESETTFSKLKGTWETVSFWEWERYYYLDDPSCQYHYDYEHIPEYSQTDEDFHVVYFGDNFAKIIASGDETLVGMAAPYSLTDGNQLSCLLYYGDFTPYVTVEFEGDNYMTLTLEEEGSDSDTHYQLKQILKYKRVGTSDITIEVTSPEPPDWYIVWDGPDDTDGPGGTEDEPDSDDGAVTGVVWEVIKYAMTDYQEMMDSEGNTQVLANVNVNEYDVTSEDEVYHTLCFNSENIILYSTNNKEMSDLVNVVYPYTLTDNQLKCELLAGEYADFVTVEYSDDTMILTLDDNGEYKDEKGNVYYKKFRSVTTYRRIY